MARISRIVIDQQSAQIGVNSNPAQMRISKPKKQMNITKETPKMEFNNTMPTFKVNRRKINSESGLKPTMELSKDYANKGKSGALKGAAQAKSDGNFLGEVRNPGDRVARLARNKTMGAILDKQQANLGLMPQSPPEITWDKGQTRIDWSGHSLVIDWEGDEFMPQVTVESPHSVEVYLRTKPYFRIRVEEGSPSPPTGNQINQAI